MLSEYDHERANPVVVIGKDQGLSGGEIGALIAVFGACLLLGSATAFDRDLAISWIACFARLSETGFFPTKIARGERSSGILA